MRNLTWALWGVLWVLLYPVLPRHYRKNLAVIITHKWHVWQAGSSFIIPRWRLLLHDLSKFSPEEFGPYARHFYGVAAQVGDAGTVLSNYIQGKDPAAEWDKAKHLHYRRNPHHVEYWRWREGDPQLDEDQWAKAEGRILTEGDVVLAPMPATYVAEAVADWLAASRAYTGTWPDPLEWAWFDAAFPTMVLHPHTRNLITSMVAEVRTYNPPEGMMPAHWYVLCAIGERTVGVLSLYGKVANNHERACLQQALADLTGWNLVDTVTSGTLTSDSPDDVEVFWYQWRGRLSARGLLLYTSMRYSSGV